MKSMTLKSMSALALALVAGGALATTPVAAEESTGQVEFKGGKLEFGDNGKTGRTVPSFDFGQQDIVADNKTYNAIAVKELNVSDLRGTGAGWNVTVAQPDQLKTAGGVELKGAQLTLKYGIITNTSNELPTGNDATIIPGGAAVSVLTAQAGTGNGTSTVTWPENRANLFVPGTTTKKAEQYTATLVWTLNSTPN